MKRILTLLLTVAVLFGVTLQGQVIPEYLQKRNEIYFTFQVENHADVNKLTSLISIDNVKDKTVWAYANVPQYLKFLKMGYDITLLPTPGDAPGVVMSDNGVLSPLTTWNFYPTYDAYESLMTQFQTLYPSLCNLDTITTLASGRRLLVLKISDNVATDESEPEYLYTSSIHGDEATGYILMMHLADYLLTNYGTNPEATDLINNTEIYICPLANPDGTYYGGNASVSGARRYNINGVDLNRNYPDPQAGQHPDGYAWQPETMAFMDFATQHHFVGACNFHGGIEVVNYPWDTWAALHPDDNWYLYTSREYADTVHIHSPAGYMDDLVNGVTNGYAWYQVTGGRQDYMNYYQHCREITIELSTTKLVAASTLPSYWDYNWRSLILQIKESRYGIHGIITDQVTGNPVAAKVFITGHDALNTEVYSSANLGDYHRPVKAGTYTLEISAPCYQTQTITGVTVADHATLTLNIQLVPGATAAVNTAAVTSITASGATSGGTVTCTGNTAVTARGVCWSTSANPVATGNHTTNGSGAGTFTSQITGLLTSTIYHVRAYATNTSGTYYGTDVQFTTSCGAVAVFPWNEGFENAGAIPGCWTQEQVNASGINWVFITGSGNSHPTIAHGGTYDACLKDATPGDNKTRLISPPLNLTSVSSPQLKFWHTQAVWSGDQDQLTVFIKPYGGAWTQVATYTASITAWTQETIILPTPTNDYYIAFEGNAKYGYGVCIDDVQVSTSCLSTVPVSISITASASTVCQGSSVVFSATPANGGTTPGYQWKVNGSPVSGATNISYTYAPANSDQVTCVLTSNASCITGNPATSNVVTMTVNQPLPVSISIEASANPVDAGLLVTYTATPVNGGASPAYQWKVNGTNAGANLNSFSYTPVDGDVVSCTLTSSDLCVSSNPAASNTITMVVNSIPPTLSLQETTVTGTDCFNATQTIEVAGNGTSFVVQAGGNATLIAGQNILFYPGTLVNDGGYLLGTIAPGGPWCMAPAIVSAMTGEEDSFLPSGGSFFSIYPNPTSGEFMLELRNTGLTGKIRVEMFGMKGDMIFSSEFPGEMKEHLSLSGKPAGVYLVRVVSGENTGTARIIKQ